MLNEDQKQQEWIKNLGKNLIKSFQLKIGDTIIYDSEKDIYNNYDNNHNYKNMIGNDTIKSFESLISNNSYCYVPLNFTFDKNNIINQKERERDKDYIFTQNPQDIFIEL